MAGLTNRLPVNFKVNCVQYGYIINGPARDRVHSGAEGCNPVFAHWPNLSLGAGDTLSRIRHSGIKRRALAESSTTRHTWRARVDRGSPPLLPPPPSPIRYSFFRIFLHRPNPLLCPTQRRRWNSRGTPRQRSHCFSLNNTSAIFELRCQREQRYRIRSATVLRRPNTTTSPENAGRETREREREKNEPALSGY